MQQVNTPFECIRRERVVDVPSHTQRRKRADLYNKDHFFYSCDRPFTKGGCGVVYKEAITPFLSKQEVRERAYLSNFYPCELTVRGILFPSSEHAFHYFRVLNPSRIPEGVVEPEGLRQLLADAILATSTPSQAQYVARYVKPTKSKLGECHADQRFMWQRDLLKRMRSLFHFGLEVGIWADREDDVSIMEEVLIAKFSQNPHLAAKLRATAGMYLTEHTTRDAFWGDGGVGPEWRVLHIEQIGFNSLGLCLMRIRDGLLQLQSPAVGEKRKRECD